VTEIKITRPGSGYASIPNVEIKSPKGTSAKAEAIIENGNVTAIKVTSGGSGFAAENTVIVLKGGADFSTADNVFSPGDVNPLYYIYGILLMAIVTGTYTILGGLKAVIVTDVIQSILVLVAGVIVALATYSAFADITPRDSVSTDAISVTNAWAGWNAMVSEDLESGNPRLNLYNPIDHPGLPWTGVLSGLMVLHFFYWGANQFIVQRALSARTDGDARMGIIFAGFFKLLIPFFSIGCGIAAFYLYNRHWQADIPQDIVFIKLLTDLIVPLKYGLAGLVAAGVVGAILSSLDSMMNSAATIITYDIYKRYIAPKASEKALINVGRLCIVISIVLAAVFTIFTMDPNSNESFFLQIASFQGRLVAGVVVVFLVGMFWKRATANGAFAALLVGIIMSFAIPFAYPYIADTVEKKTPVKVAKIDVAEGEVVASASDEQI